MAPFAFWRVFPGGGGEGLDGLGQRGWLGVAGAGLSPTVICTR